MSSKIQAPPLVEKPKPDSSFISNKRALQLLAGAVSGAIARTIISPFERTIILQQTKNPKYLGFRVDQIVLNMVKNEGFTSLFKGNGTNVLRIMPFSAVELCSFEIYKQHLSKVVNSKESLYFLAGACAGMTASTLVYPLDLIRTLFAFQTDTKAYNGILGSMSKIVKENGFRGLFRGLGATLMGITPYASLKLTFFQLLKNRFSENGTLSAWTNLFSGAVAGCGAVSITYPTDLIRRRLQIQVLQNNINAGYFATIKEIYHQEGIRGFYRGLPTTYLKIMPSAAITFMLNESLKTQWNCH